MWLLLAPRDYLSTFMKIGTIVLLAVGILVARPVMQNAGGHATSPSSGTGPVFAGTLFPFLFITIACGALSGFHALIASGTTPKMIDEGAPDPADRLRRHADGVVRRHHGADRRVVDRPAASTSR